jgi:hypothetical protein
MNTKMHCNALIACVMMILPSLYADIFSASVQMTIKSVIIPFLLVGT